MDGVDEYIFTFPEEVQIRLKQIRESIKKIAPDATEAINYGIPTFKLNGNLVHFAAFKKHIGFYPAPSGLAEFKAEIEKYKHSKGAVQFQHKEEIPFALIEKIVRFRLQESMKK